MRARLLPQRHASHRRGLKERARRWGDRHSQTRRAGAGRGTAALSKEMGSPRSPFRPQPGPRAPCRERACACTQPGHSHTKGAPGAALPAPRKPGKLTPGLRGASKDFHVVWGRPGQTAGALDEADPAVSHTPRLLRFCFSASTGGKRQKVSWRLVGPSWCPPPAPTQVNLSSPHPPVTMGRSGKTPPHMDSVFPQVTSSSEGPSGWQSYG